MARNEFYQVTGVADIASHNTLDVSFSPRFSVFSSLFLSGDISSYFLPLFMVDNLIQHLAKLCLKHYIWCKSCNIKLLQISPQTIECFLFRYSFYADTFAHCANLIVKMIQGGNCSNLSNVNATKMNKICM